jgi:hypothetical protein
VLHIPVLFDIKDLPFHSLNFAQPVVASFWNFPDDNNTVSDNFEGKLEPITKDFKSSVQLVPNNSTLVSFNYNLDQVYETLFTDSYGEADGNLRCVVFEFKLSE